MGACMQCAAKMVLESGHHMSCDARTGSNSGLRLAQCISGCLLSFCVDNAHKTLECGVLLSLELQTLHVAWSKSSEHTQCART